MSWGDSFKSAWNSASDAARSAASAVATGAKAVADGTAAAAQFLAREANDMARTAVAAAVAAGQAIASTAMAVEHKVVDATNWAIDQTKKAAIAAADATVVAAKATARGVAAAYHAAKKAFSAAAVGLATACTAVEDWVFAGIALDAGFVFTKPGISNLIRPMVRYFRDDPKSPDSQKPYDGDVLGAGCKKDGPGGVRPPRCYYPGSLPRITYVNGINTRYTADEKHKEEGLFGGGICKTMLEIASKTCCEVIGVYNATQGIGSDLDRCLDDIARQSSSKAVDPLRDMIVKAALSGQPLTIFAHSEGGLITQDALIDAKQELMSGYSDPPRPRLTSAQAEQKLSVVSIKSFGTALLGWPKGPHYERFTNTADPVPAAIIGAQTSYPAATLKDSAPADLNQNHVFTTPYLNPLSFETHDMNTTYLDAYSRIKGVPKCACKTV